MSDTSSAATAQPEQVDRLKPNAIGLAGVIFMAVAFSAPITAMTGNVPFAVGYGNGIGAPAGFIFATVILTIFSIGYVAMTRHITAAGAFYTFISKGISRPVAMGAGFLMLAAYMSMEASLVGIFAAFADSTFQAQLNIDLPWLVFAAFMLALNGILAYYDINLAARVLAVLLITEIAILALMGLGVIFSGGGPDGLPLSPLEPQGAFESKGLEAGVVGLGLLMAFWSWVGFESTAIYGEESKNPRKIVPRATLIAVIGIGLFYTFISWSAIVGNGLNQSVALARGDTPFELLFAPTREYVGGWAVTLFEWLLISGSFACGFAIHNSASRYLYAFGREGLIWRPLGRTQKVHRSPHIASFTQTAYASTVVLLFALFGQDPYASLYVLLAVFATICILTVQTLCAAAVIGYFHVYRHHPETANVFRTLLAPIVGGLGMIVVVYLLLSNMDAAAGDASKTLFFRVMPWLAVLAGVGGVVAALVLRAKRPHLYARIGRVAYDDHSETPLIDADDPHLPPAARPAVTGLDTQPERTTA
jgi:amino acid transporter